MAWQGREIQRKGKVSQGYAWQRQRKATAMRRNSFMLDFAYKQKGVIFMKGLVFDTENRMQLKDFGRRCRETITLNIAVNKTDEEMIF